MFPYPPQNKISVPPPNPRRPCLLQEWENAPAPHPRLDVLIHKNVPMLCHFFAVVCLEGPATRRLGGDGGRSGRGGTQIRAGGEEGDSEWTMVFVVGDGVYY